MDTFIKDALRQVPGGENARACESFADLIKLARMISCGSLYGRGYNDFRFLRNLLIAVPHKSEWVGLYSYRMKFDYVALPKLEKVSTFDDCVAWEINLVHSDGIKLTINVYGGDSFNGDRLDLEERFEFIFTENHQAEAWWPEMFQFIERELSLALHYKAERDVEDELARQHELKVLKAASQYLRKL